MRRRRADLVLASWTLAYFASLLPIGAHFDRYVLPLVPALAVLAARFTTVAAVLLLLLVVPLTWTVRDARDLTRTDTRAAAVQRVEQAVDSAPVAVDPGLPDPSADLVRLQLPAPWRPPDPNRDLAKLRAVDVGPVFVWVNGSIVDRVRKARDEYPRENAFYDALEREGQLVFRIDPGGEYAGPWTALYRLRR
jgi:hypothetical protein